MYTVHLCADNGCMCDNFDLLYSDSMVMSSKPIVIRQNTIHVYEYFCQIIKCLFDSHRHDTLLFLLSLWYKQILPSTNVLTRGAHTFALWFV